MILILLIPLLLFPLPSQIDTEFVIQHPDFILTAYEISDVSNKKDILQSYFDYPNWMNTFFDWNEKDWTTNLELEQIMDFAVSSDQVTFEMWKYNLVWKAEQMNMKWQEYLRMNP